MYTRTALCFDWYYTTDCHVEDHGHIEITAFQCGRCRDPAAVLIPHEPPHSLQDAVDALFLTGAASDFSFPGPAPCPPCGESCARNISASVLSIIPWGADNPPDLVFFAN